MYLDLRPPDTGAADVCGRAERRAHERLSAPLPALVRVGQVEEAAALEDIGPGGLRVRLCLRPAPGARVFALVRFTAARGIEGEGPLVAVRGRVLRVEPGAGGAYGVAITITRYRFL